MNSYCCAAFFILLLRVANTYLEVTDEQIIQHTPGKHSLALAWTDITNVKTNKISQRLELRSNIKSQSTSIACQVQDFVELILLRCLFYSTASCGQHLS